MPSFQVTCPFCMALIEDDRERCFVCDEPLTIATLVCTRPVGGVKKGDVWPLRPRPYMIGRGSEADVLIRDEYVSRSHTQLSYKDGSFISKRVSSDATQKEKTPVALLESTPIPVGDGEFKVHYLRDVAAWRAKTGDAARIALSSFVKVSSFLDPGAICTELLDGVLRMSGLEKAYVFSLGGGSPVPGSDISLRPVASRSASLKNLGDTAFPISHGFLQKVLASEGKAIIMDSESASSQSLTDSIVKLKLQSIVCCPMLKRNGSVAGIMYADSQRRVMRQDLFNLRPVISMFSMAVAGRLLALNPSNPFLDPQTAFSSND